MTSSIKETEPRPQPPPKIPNIRGYFDPRRVTSVNQVASENMFHAKIAASSIPQHKIQAATSATDKVELGPDPLSDPGVVHIPSGEMGAEPEMLPMGFGPGPVILPGETVGEKSRGFQ